MADQSLKLNILSFAHQHKPVGFSFFKEPMEGYKSLALYEAPIELKDRINGNGTEEIKNIYTDFITTENADFRAEVDLTKSKNFAKHYYTHIIHQYLKEKVDFISPNFVNDIEVWIHEAKLSTKLYKTYRIFCVRVQIANISETPELVIYHKGLSRISNKSITELWDISQDKYIKIVFKNEFYYFQKKPDDAKYNLEQVYPIINKSLENYFEITNTTNPFANKYKELYPLINNFISTYFDNDEFRKHINLTSINFLDVPEKITFHTRVDSNFIQLGQENKVKVFTPKTNLKKYGPYSLPQNTNVKFMVIYHKNDRDYANRLFMYMKKLYQKPDGTMMTDRYGTSLYEFIRINFDLDKEHSITFEDEMNPYDAIHEYIDKTDIDIENYQYVAIYLSPFNKDESDPSKKRIYYRVKETLLKHHITSQVIYREHLLDKKFKSYYYANIAVAILAKVGGIPWRLDCPIKNELVVGVGAYKSKEFGIQYIGSAFSFSNSGEFNEFSCTSKSECSLLAAKIKIYIHDYVKKNQNIERLIIHFYKEMKREEIAPVTKALFELGYKNIPIFIITINKTFAKDYIAFDTNSDALIPYSGTILNIAKNKYLLFNNTRYINAEFESIESYHLPIKLSFRCTQPELLDDKSTIKDMIDQIYQFSRMYWKSVKQQNLPVTVKYPELVARMYPYFESKDIPDFGKTNLWFL